MTLDGHIRNGVVVLDGPLLLPDGTPVIVTVPDPSQPATPEPRVVLQPGMLPIVTGGSPGVWNLTNETIEQVFLEEDLEAMRRSGPVPS
ncbi:MAG TPA: hypothetical protein PKC18_17555 [Lacipirellulaceae bacterium]|nr:hypothetical protein [Lacipirellulaceae bacterium]